MSLLIVVGNPVLSAAETVVEITRYESVEDAEAAINAAVLEPIETIGSVRWSFREGTPYRLFNRIGWSGTLKQHCFGRSSGGWEVHGGGAYACDCGRDPAHYSMWESPRMLVLQDGTA